MLKPSNPSKGICHAIEFWGMSVLGDAHWVGAKDATPREAICSYKTLMSAVLGNTLE
ncbi:MAG: hypothetical protein ACI92Z_000445 [Paracoccaceae bacterium]|jgi:hypothetical protein